MTLEVATLRGQSVVEEEELTEELEEEEREDGRDVEVRIEGGDDELKRKEKLRNNWLGNWLGYLKLTETWLSRP